MSRSRLPHVSLDVLPLENARLTALREYVSLWERGLGTPDAFVTRALAALLTPGCTAKTLYLLQPFRELHAALVVEVRAALTGSLVRPTRGVPRPVDPVTRVVLEAWLASSAEEEASDAAPKDQGLERRGRP